MTAGPLRVLQVITELAPGGAERVVVELTRELLARGHSVVVCSLRPLPKQSPIVDDLRAAGVPIESLGVEKARPHRLATFGQVVTRCRPDVVHAHLFHANIVTRLLSGRRRTFAVVNSVHVAERRPRARWHFWLDRASLAACDVQTAVSHTVAQFHASKLGIEPSRIRVVYNGIRPPALLSGEDRAALRQSWGVGDCHRVLGCVGRLDRQKGFDLLLGRLAELGQRIPPGERFGLVILGEGRERWALERLAGAAPGNVVVRLPGFRADAPSAMGAFDLFLMPSRYEGYGLVAAEAMCHGLPIVVSQAEGPAELIDGYELGRVADFRSPATWDLIVQHATLNRGPPRLRHSVEQMADGYLAAYRAAAK